MRIGAFLFAAALLWPAVVPAQDLSGSYRYQGPDGAAVLTLRQESPVRLTGTLEMTNGASFGIEGQVENGRATGDVIFDGGRGFFAAGFQGSTLLVVIAERNPANGQPMLDAGWSLQFARVQGGSGEPAAAGASVPAPYAGVVPAPAARPAPAPSPSSAAVMPQQGSPGAGAGTSAANGGFAQTDQSP